MLHYPKREQTLFIHLFFRDGSQQKKNIQNCPPNPVIAGFHPIYDLKLPLVRKGADQANYVYIYVPI